MTVDVLFSPTTLLWLVVSAFAVTILLGSIHRRRSRLTETLRDYVDRHQKIGEDSRDDQEAPD